MDRTCCALSLCEDGLMHLYEVCDDGAPIKVAVCGSESPARSIGDDDSFVCDECAEWLANWANPEDPEAFLRAAEG